MSKIVQDKDLLGVKSDDVSSVEEALDIIDKLSVALRETSNGLGLAAVQIGVPKKVGVIEYKGKSVYLINPKFVESDEEFIFPNEGCLSFPGKFLNTKRYRHYIIDNNIIENGQFRVQREYYFYGDPEDRSNDDIVAIAVQHEMDHFDGRLIVDHGIKSEPIKRDNSKVGRNDPCPCGSGKKYKKCCLSN